MKPNPTDTKQFGTINRAIILNSRVSTLSLKQVRATVYIHSDPIRHALNVRWQAYFRGKAAIDEVFPYATDT